MALERAESIWREAWGILEAKHPDYCPIHRAPFSNSNHRLSKEPNTAIHHPERIGGAIFTVYDVLPPGFSITAEFEFAHSVDSGLRFKNTGHGLMVPLNAYDVVNYFLQRPDVNCSLEYNGRNLLNNPISRIRQRSAEELVGMPG